MKMLFSLVGDIGHLWMGILLWAVCLGLWVTRSWESFGWGVNFAAWEFFGLDVCVSKREGICLWQLFYLRLLMNSLFVMNFNIT